MASKTKSFFSEVYSRQTDSMQAGRDNVDNGQRARDVLAEGLRSPAPYQWMSPHQRQSMRMTGPIYVAIKVLAEQAHMAQITCYKWSKQARMGGDRDHKEPLPRNHPLCRLMRRPNPKFSDGYLRRQMVQQLALTGSSLVWRIDQGLGRLARPVELWNIPTAIAQPMGGISAAYPNGGYWISPYYPGPVSAWSNQMGSGGVPVMAENILDIRSPHPLLTNGEGYSPLQACSLPLDTVESIDQCRFSKMRRGTWPNLIVEQDPTARMPDETELFRVKTALMQALGTPTNAGAAAILSPGMKLASQDKGDAEIGWVDSWGQLVGFVMSVFGVSKSAAQMNEDTSYGALYAGLKQFNLFSMCPLLQMLEDAFNIGIVEPYFGDDYFIELTPRKIDDETIKDQQINTALKCGAVLVNEVRAYLGLELVEEPWGEERAWATGKPDATGDANAQDDSKDPNEKDRPDNEEGKDSLVDRGGSKGLSRLLNGKHLNGHALNGKH